MNLICNLPPVEKGLNPLNNGGIFKCYFKMKKFNIHFKLTADVEKEASDRERVLVASTKFDSSTRLLITAAFGSDAPRARTTRPAPR